MPTCHEAGVESPELPFDLEVVRFFTNATIREIQPGDKLLATKGRGLKFTMTEERPLGGKFRGIRPARRLGQNLSQEIG